MLTDLKKDLFDRNCLRATTMFQYLYCHADAYGELGVDSFCLTILLFGDLVFVTQRDRFPFRSVLHPLALIH